MSKGKIRRSKGSMADCWDYMEKVLIMYYTFTWSDLKRAGEGQQVTPIPHAGDTLWK